MFMPTDSLPSHKSTSGGLGWDNNVIGISTWSWCYALWSSLAFPHDLDATLYDLQSQFHMILMLRSMIFIGISTWSWCCALWSSIAIPHNLDATLYDLQSQFHMILMLRSMIFNCNSTWSWCYALWSSIGISTWSWCYALWSSIGISTWSWCYALWVGWGGVITSMSLRAKWMRRHAWVLSFLWSLCYVLT